LRGDVYFPAASLKVKADKERELRDTVCKQLVEGKRTIGKYSPTSDQGIWTKGRIVGADFSRG